MNSLFFQVGLTASKMACGEGGCGACTVVVSSWNEHKNEVEHKAMNSCLTGIPFVAGANVTTPEGLGSTSEGMHPIQKAFVDKFGTQCGYCTPGFLMSLYGGVLNGKKTAVELEKTIDGNLCRCTGYRSIYEAVKEIEGQLAAETNPSACAPSLDPSSPFYADATRFTTGQFEEMRGIRPKPATYVGPRTTWLSPTTLDELLQIKAEHPDVRLITGNSEVKNNFSFVSFFYISFPSSSFLFSLSPPSHQCLCSGHDRTTLQAPPVSHPIHPHPHRRTPNPRLH